VEKKNSFVEKNDNRILEVKTTQTAALKQVIERIQSVVSETCIVFIPPDNTDDNDIDDEYESEEEVNNLKSKKKSKKDSKLPAPTKKKNKNKKDISESESDSESDSDSDDNPRAKKSTKAKKKVESDSESESESESIPKGKTKSKAAVATKTKKPVPAKDDDKTIKKKNNLPAQPTKKRNTGGIRILRLTQDKSVLIKLILDAVNFEYFKCTEPKITIGIDMSQLHAMLKSINDNDPITLYMNRDNRSTLYIHSTSENNEHTEETDLEVCLMDIGNQEMPLPRAEFQNKITMAADKFHTICKHLNNNSVHVEITSINNEISFKGKNEGGKISRTYKDANSKKKDKQNHVVQGNYELRNLMYFSKCNKLCQTIDIYLKNDFPLVLVISVATLGKMYIFLTPTDQDVNV